MVCGISLFQSGLALNLGLGKFLIVEVYQADYWGLSFPVN